jgi:hypothetical protein
VWFVADSCTKAIWAIEVVQEGVLERHVAGDLIGP